MTKHPRITRRGNVYYHRVMVPKDLIEKYGKRELTKSLRTKELAEAKRLGRILDVQLDEEFEIYRTSMSGEIPVIAKATPSIKQACAAKFKEITETDFTYRAEVYAKAEADPDSFYAGEILPLPNTDFFYHRTQENPLLEDMLAYVFKFDLQSRLEIAERILASGNYKLDGDPQLVQGLLQAEIKALEVLISRTPPDIEPEGNKTEIPAEVHSGPTFTEAKSTYIAELRQRKVPEKTVLAQESALMIFVDVAGDKKLTEYLKSEGAAYKQALTKAPVYMNTRKEFKDLNVVEAGKHAEKLGDIPRLSIGTINDKIGTVSTFFRWAKKNNDGHIENPVDGLKIREIRGKMEKALPFTLPQLIKLFNAPIYTGCKNEKNWRSPGNLILLDTSKFWVPLIGLFTGMRLGEIIQLTGNDVRVMDDVTYIDINTDGEGKKTKTFSSIRKIPIHRELERIGFIDFAVNKMGRLFSDYKQADSGSWSDNFGKHFSRHRKSVGVDSGNFHSLRHGFEDACRNSGVSADIMQALQGHTPPGMNGIYGSGFNIKVLNKAVRKIKYNGLDLVHL